MGLGYIQPDFTHSSSSLDVSADGSIVVGWSTIEENHTTSHEGFRWTEADGMVGLGGLGLGRPTSEARGVSADGSVIVGESRTEDGWEAFRWTESDGMVSLGDLPFSFVSSEAYAVSADGSVIVGRGRSIFGNEAFRWTEADGMVGLGDLPGGSVYSAAFSVSTDGSTIVGIGNGPSNRTAIVWTESNGMQSLQVLLTSLGVDLTGWDLDWASDVSADGLTIVGSGINPSGDREAFIAVIPEPSTALLIGLGLVGLGYGRRRA